jgi:hypothetical protein
MKTYLLAILPKPSKVVETAVEGVQSVRHENMAPVELQTKAR